jgi:ferrous iron transport protein B
MSKTVRVKKEIVVSLADVPADASAGLPAAVSVGNGPTNLVDYGRSVEKEIRALETTIALYPEIVNHFPPRWLAIKLLEGGADIQGKVMGLECGPALLTDTQISAAKLEEIYGEDIDVLIADRRYAYINNLVGRVMIKTGDDQTLSDKIDRIVTHRVLGVFIFLGVMWVVFKITADVSAPLLDWVNGVITGPITTWTLAVSGILGLGGSWLEGLVVNGIIAGVGGVLVFVPVLMFLYISLALLEDSGYMARAAFVMDNLMAKIGLQGKSFLPMMVGFGCTVPAIYATRTLENDKDRILTGLLVPFMSCGARLPVYVLFAAVFFPRNAGLVIFGMYLLGIVTAMMLGYVLRKTVFRDKEQTALLMELPPYHRPNLRTVWSHTWERTGSFIKHAWSLILVTSIILWFLVAIPVGADSGNFADTDIDQSLFATVSGAVSPALEPLGFGSWESSGALITGFVAKEVVISTMAQIYALEESEESPDPSNFFNDLGQIITTFGRAIFDTVKAMPLVIGINLSDGDEEDPDQETGPGALQGAVHAAFEASSGGHAALAGLAFMVFVLIYTPCMVAIAAEKNEFGARWMLASVVGQLILAWLMAMIVFQLGKLLFG